MLLPLHILATGIGVAHDTVTSLQLDEQLKLSPGATEKRSGVQTRQFARPGELQSDLAAEAVRHALARAGLKWNDIDLLISASGVPEQALPSTGAAVVRQLQSTRGTPAIDVGASCLSFMAALQVASGLLAAGAYRRIAVVASDLPSRGVDWSSHEASMIFGDGAAAAIVEKGDGTRGFRSFGLETYPEGFDHCAVRAGGTRRNPRVGVTPQDYLFRMDGKAVFKLASNVVPRLLAETLQAGESSLEDIDVVVPHQASNLGMAHLFKRLALPVEKVVNIYATHGNQVSASMPTALHFAYEQGLAGNGKRALLLGTAAGFTAGAAVLDL